MLAEVREHLHFVRAAMRGLRKLRIAREVSCRSSGNGTAKPNGARLLGKVLSLSFPAGLYLTAKGLFFLCFSLLLSAVACLHRLEQGLDGQGCPYSGLAHNARVGWLDGRE